MNKKQSFQESGVGPAKARRSAGTANRVRREEGGWGAATEPLAREAQRLLAALGEPEAYALADPTDEGMLLVRKVRAGVSVGAGRFALAAADELGRRDLAGWVREAGQKLLRISVPGEAHRRRGLAGAADNPFRAQHGDIVAGEVETRTGRMPVRFEAEESPLDWLRRRKDRDGQPLIDGVSYQAGERLRADITLAALLPSVTSRWDPIRADGGPRRPADATDRMMAARQRIKNAFAAVGADFSDLLIDLCGFLKGLEAIERDRGWPQRSAKVVVRIALARLAEHYGLEAVATGPAASRRIRAWQAVVIEGGRA
jgi:hypothetical protein